MPCDHAERLDAARRRVAGGRRRGTGGAIVLEIAISGLLAPTVADREEQCEAEGPAVRMAPMPSQMADQCMGGA